MSEAGVTGLDWPGLLAAGLKELRLRPAEFWALTPYELMLMLGRDQTLKPLKFQDFDQLMARFPDRGHRGNSAKE